MTQDERAVVRNIVQNFRASAGGSPGQLAFVIGIATNMLEALLQDDEPQDNQPPIELT